MEHLSPTTIYFQSLSLLADHLRAQIRIKDKGVTILLQPATYDIPKILPYLFPTYTHVTPVSAEQVLDYLESLPTALSLPTKTLLVIDEHSSSLMLKIRSFLFTSYETHASGAVFLTKDLPQNLSVCIILSRALIERQASDTQVSILNQYHIYSIKTASVGEPLRHRVPLVIDLGWIGKKAITDLIFNMLTRDPRHEPAIKMGERSLSHRDIQRFVSATNPISPSSALHNFVFYVSTPLREAALPQLSSETDTLYQLMRSFFSASLRDPRADMTTSRSSALHYISLRLVRNLPVHIPSAHAFFFLSTKRLPTKRNLNQIYLDALQSDISPNTILSWLYDYIYDVYHTADQIGHFCECVSALYSTSDRLPTYTSAFSLQVAWIVHELCVLKFTKLHSLPQTMRRLSSFCPPRQPSVKRINSLDAHEQYAHLHNNLDVLSAPIEHLKEKSGHSDSPDSESELTS
ncbi:hypothetical protein GL50803_0010766 [Giardia duodenalis]|uniref:Uncharacterized protein n=1 Tax=Giardia intestinalis (strain ATCC 50803 / WB clone C6) TaxID=184922 RepID=D3KHF4_GIAIC|nr:hypothetical protein GL50803_0010766 [Giardia intestinalis]KAE8303907.1 hypothetical protein GL50803_0010766 [Giardia intestinalis]